MRKQPDNGVDERTGGINEDYVHIYGDKSERRDGRWNDGQDVSRAAYSTGFMGLSKCLRLRLKPIQDPTPKTQTIR